MLWNFFFLLAYLKIVRKILYIIIYLQISVKMKKRIGQFLVKRDQISEIMHRNY